MHPIITIEVVRERRERYLHEARTWRTLPTPSSRSYRRVVRQAVGWALVRAGLRLVQHPPSPALRSP